MSWNRIFDFEYRILWQKKVNENKRKELDDGQQTKLSKLGKKDR